MDTLVAFCRKLHLGRAFAMLAAASLLLLNIACSSSNIAGARPNNPPVQMGGQNNPQKEKGNGDGYNDYKASTDPAVVKRDRASLVNPNQLIANASKTVERSASERINQAKDATQRQSSEAMKEVNQILEQPQVVVNRSDPDVKILEKVGNTFKEASKHLTGDTDTSIEQSGVSQSN